MSMKDASLVASRMSQSGEPAEISVLPRASRRATLGPARSSHKQQITFSVAKVPIVGRSPLEWFNEELQLIGDQIARYRLVVIMS